MNKFLDNEHCSCSCSDWADCDIKRRRYGSIADHSLQLHHSYLLLDFCPVADTMCRERFCANIQLEWFANIKNIHLIHGRSIWSMLCFLSGTWAVQPVATCRQSPYFHKPAIVIVTSFSFMAHAAPRSRYDAILIAAAYGWFSGICQVVPVCTPPTISFLGPTRAHNAITISIGSAIFAQLTAAPSPIKFAPSHGGSGPNLIHGSLGSLESSTQNGMYSTIIYDQMVTV